MKSQCPYPAAKEKAEEVSGSWHAGSLHGISPLRLYRLYTKYISMYPNEVTESGSWRSRLDIGCTVVHIGSSLAKVRTKKCVCKLISHDRNGTATPSRGFSRWIVAGRSLICNAATRLPVRHTNATHTLESSDIYAQFCNWKACLWRKS